MTTVALQPFRQELRDAVFRTSSAGSTTRVAISGFTRQDVVYVLPERSSAAVKEAFTYHLMVTGTSPSSDRAVWRTFVLSLVNVCFPAFGTQVLDSQPSLYERRVVTPDQITAMQTGLTLREEWQQAGDISPEDVAAFKRETADAFPVLDALPPVTSAQMVSITRPCLQLEAIYGYVSLVLFLAGKSITDRNRAAITIKRPNAIERKYGLGPVACLTGVLRLSDASHIGINLAFVTMHHARAEIFKEVARFSHETGDMGIEVAATTTRLMAFSGMQHVVLIDKFLSANPAAARYPVLASALVAYVSSLRELENTPVDQRPFFKLIKGDTTRAFNRRDVEALLVVAITTEMATTPSLAQYNLPDNADEIMTVYRENHQYYSAIGL